MSQSKAATEEWGVPTEDQMGFDPLLECLGILTRHFGKPYSHDSLRAGMPLREWQIYCRTIYKICRTSWAVIQTSQA